MEAANVKGKIQGQYSNGRKSSRLRGIPAPYIRTSLSPEIYARAFCLGKPLPQSKYRPLDDDLFSNEEGGCSPNNDMERALDQLHNIATTGIVNPEQESQSLHVVHAARYVPKLHPRVSGCWLCRIRHKKCTPEGDSCHSCIYFGVECHGKGRRRDAWMLKFSASYEYIKKYTLDPENTRQKALLQRDKGKPNSKLPMTSITQRATKVPSKLHRNDILAQSEVLQPTQQIKLRPGPSHINSTDRSLFLAKQDNDPDSNSDSSDHISISSASSDPITPRPETKCLNSKAKSHSSSVNVAQFLTGLDLDHICPLFHQLHLRSAQDLQRMSKSVGDPVEREELWRLLQTKGLSIINWWTIAKALTV